MIDARQETLFGWGRANHARSRVYRPTDPGEVQEAVTDARRRGLTIAHRGTGQSYGDAALNQGGAVLRTDRLDRILEYDPKEGRLRAEAGVTVDQLWRRVLADGWWPPVVPGTSRPTLGGCLAMNVHGKNHVQAGSFGEHVRSVTVLEPGDETTRIRADEAGFDRVVGTQGTFGTILSLEIDLREVASGYLQVEARPAPDLGQAMAGLEELEGRHDYTVAWVDCFAGGASPGRAELHGASHLGSSHRRAGEGLSVEEQVPPDHLLGLFPRRQVPKALRLLIHDPGMRVLNASKYLQARALHPSSYLQPHARFHFLLDFVPGWKEAYGSGGLLQYQFFVPEETAEDVFREAIRRQHERGVVSYLGVLKRHRRDPFPGNYSVDGYSLALDFPVHRGRLRPLMALLDDFDRLQEEAGGSVYAAKDAASTLASLRERPEADRLEVYSSNLLRRWEKGGRRAHTAT